MRRCKSLLSRLLVAALVSGLAAILMVTIGPGFAENDGPSENASEQAQANAADDGASNSAATEDGTKDTPSADAESEELANDGSQFDPDGTGGNASDAPNPDDENQHVGAGTENPEGSGADPGHDANENSQEKFQSSGTGNGDVPADECDNQNLSVNDADDNDFSGAGSNKTGVYDSTCDGRISQNGQGDDANGMSTGYAAEEGNADDKNPPGQVREFYGTKVDDMGYECDGNQGIGAHYGNGNPAHTGRCATASPSPSPSTSPAMMQVCREVSAGNWDVIEIPEGTDLPTDKPANAEECNPTPSTLDLCHKLPNGTFVARTIDSDELAEHLAHGDIYPMPTSGCQPPAASTLDLCHKLPNGTFVARTIDSDELAEHLAHGDIYPMPTSGCGTAAESTLDLCHKLPNGTFVARTIASDELDEHLAHGDIYPMPTSGCVTVDAERFVTICHATGSETNPFVIITVSERALEQGHDDTHGDLNPVSLEECAGGPAPATLDVCHKLDNGTFVVDTIDSDDLAEHLAHGDMYPIPASGCATVANERFVTVCHAMGNGEWEIKSIQEDALAGHLQHGDKYPVPVGGCAESSPATLDICHKDGSTFTVTTIPTDELADHIQHGDMYPIPTDGCNPPSVQVCPADTQMNGLPVPANGNCNPVATPSSGGGRGRGSNPPIPEVLAVVTKVVVVCPDDSDNPGMVLKPKQTAEDCYADDVAGKQVKFIPAPAVKNIPDRVQPNLIRNRPQPAPKVKGGVLPFTGASVLAFLVLALQLIAAGSLILRGKRA